MPNNLISIKRQLSYLSLLLLCIPAQASRTLCAPTEEVYFSCAASDKIISLCASSNLSRDAGTLQYRFGTGRGHVAMAFPRPASHPREHFTESHESSAKAGAEAIGFQSGGYAYAVFVTRAAFGYNGAGVTVGRDGRRLSFIQCDARTITSDRLFENGAALGIPQGEIDYNGAETVVSE